MATAICPTMGHIFNVNLVQRESCEGYLGKTVRRVLSKRPYPDPRRAL